MYSATGSKKRKKSSDGSKQKKDKKKDKETKKKNDMTADPDLDLNRVLKPVGDYIRDREEMVNQMFRALQGPKLKAMLPDLLKDIPEDELKQLCVEHLDIMSKKRIRRILAGADPETISSSGTEEETSDEDEPVKTKVVEPRCQNQPADSTSQTQEDERSAESEVTDMVTGSLQIDAEGDEDASSISDNHGNTDSMEDGEVCDSEAVALVTMDVDNKSEDEKQEEDDEDAVSQIEEEIEEDNSEQFNKNNVEEDYELNDSTPAVDRRFVLKERSPHNDVINKQEVGLGNIEKDCIVDDIEEGEMDDKDDGDNCNDTVNDNDDDAGTAHDIEAELEQLITEQAAKNLSTLSKNQLEIFELEMRRRAIKAMLNAQESGDKPK